MHRERILIRKSEVIRRGIKYAFGELDDRFFESMTDSQEEAKYVKQKYDMANRRSV